MYMYLVYECTFLCLYAIYIILADHIYVCMIESVHMLYIYMNIYAQFILYVSCMYVCMYVCMYHVLSI